MDTESENAYGVAPAAEQPSLVGLTPAAEHEAEATSQVGLTAPTSEELVIIHEQLQKKDTPGHYSNEELLKEARTQTSRETAKPIRAKTGQWLNPGEPGYDIAKQELEASGVPADSLQNEVPTNDAPTVSEGDKQAQQQDKQEREIVKDVIKAITIADEGSVDPHKRIDEVALKQVREENSTMKLKDTLGKLAALDKVALGGMVEDIDPNKLVADPIVRGPGADRAYAAAQAKKQQANDKFMEQQKSREKSLGGDKK